MRVDVSLKNMKSSSILEEGIQKNIDKVSKRLKGVKKDSAVHISVHIEKNPHKEQFFCWVTVYLPTKVLTAKRAGGEIFTIINNVFLALLKQMEKVKYKIERHLVKKKRKSLKNAFIDNI